MDRAMEFQGRHYEVDEDGYIQNLNDWSRELAEHIAGLEDINMTDAHWEVVRILREYFAKYQIAPPIKTLVKEIGKIFGQEKANTKYLYELFPGGPAKQACKIAGLPKPTGCV